MTLTTCRAYELGPIPYTVIRDYGRDLALGEDQLERLISVITQADQWFRGEIILEMKNGQGNPDNKGKPNG